MKDHNKSEFLTYALYTNAKPKTLQLHELELELLKTFQLIIFLELHSLITDTTSLVKLVERIRQFRLEHLN